jgi:hypothetical protein
MQTTPLAKLSERYPWLGEFQEHIQDIVKKCGSAHKEGRIAWVPYSRRKNKQVSAELHFSESSRQSIDTAISQKRTHINAIMSK